MKRKRLEKILLENATVAEFCVCTFSMNIMVKRGMTMREQQ